MQDRESLAGPALTPAERRGHAPVQEGILGAPCPFVFGSPCCPLLLTVSPCLWDTVSMSLPLCPPLGHCVPGSLCHYVHGSLSYCPHVSGFPHLFPYLSVTVCPCLSITMSPCLCPCIPLSLCPYVSGLLCPRISISLSPVSMSLSPCLWIPVSLCLSVTVSPCLWVIVS